MSKANCIDISCYQSSVDFAKVKAAGIQYVILRTIRKGLIVDQSFETYYKAAKAAGLKVGVYLYTYATTTSYAEKEAAALVKLLAGRALDLPVWLDMETSTLRTASAAMVQAIANAFRKKVTEAGYECGIYCDADFYKANSHFVGFDSGCEFWIASYGANDGVQHTVPSIKHNLYAHQFSSRGKVSGISGYVDVSFIYGPAKTTTVNGGFDVSTLSTIKSGSTGAQVKSLQILLNGKNSAGLAVDGIAGAKTVAAIKAYQEAMNLTVDGIAGINTWTTLLTA